MVKYLNVSKSAKVLKEKCETFKSNDLKAGWKYPNGIRAWHAPLDV